MKRLLLLALITSVLTVSTLNARTIEIDIHGMTCAFCVDSLERKFGKIKSVYKVDISLEQKKVRLETDDTELSIETIKKTVLDAGFTPIKVTVQPHEN